MDTEQFVGESEDKPQKVHLYNIEDESVKRSSLRRNTPSSSMNKNITSNTEKVKPQFQNDVKVIQKFYQNVSNSTKGAYYKDIIYLFEKANASTFMHETAHWFKGELKKFGSEKSALMLKKVDLGG